MISKKTKYALKALSILGADYSNHQPMLISDLAAQGKIPRKFLELILLDLKNHGILSSKMGKGGGYYLAKPPDQIRIGSVIRIFEGPLSPLPCLSKTAYRRCEECFDEQSCGIRLVMKEAYEAQARILDSASLQDVLDKSSDCDSIGLYSI